MSINSYHWGIIAPSQYNGFIFCNKKIIIHWFVHCVILDQYFNDILLYCDGSILVMCTVLYSISQEICTRFCFAVLCCGYILTDFPISIRLTSLALWQSNDCPSASKATLMNMDKYCMWIHYERLHNHNKAKHNKTECIFLGVYCNTSVSQAWVTFVGYDIPGMSTDYNFDAQGQLLLNGLVVTVVIIRLRQFSQLSFIQNMGLYVFSLPNSPVMIVRMCTLPHHQIGSMTH